MIVRLLVRLAVFMGRGANWLLMLVFLLLLQSSYCSNSAQVFSMASQSQTESTANFRYLQLTVLPLGSPKP